MQPLFRIPFGSTISSNSSHLSECSSTRAFQPVLYHYYVALSWRLILFVMTKCSTISLALGRDAPPLGRTRRVRMRAYVHVGMLCDRWQDADGVHLRKIRRSTKEPSSYSLTNPAIFTGRLRGKEICGEYQPWSRSHNPAIVFAGDDLTM